MLLGAIGNKSPGSMLLYFPGFFLKINEKPAIICIVVLFVSGMIQKNDGKAMLNR